MNNIEVRVLNPEAVLEAEQMMVAMARLTQRGHNISNMEDFVKLLNADYSEQTARTMAELPHPTIQKFGLVNIAIVGASRRFLAQITRHQNEVKFMSGSLQYSDYTGKAQFCVPYELIQLEESWRKTNPTAIPEHVDSPYNIYMYSCISSLKTYERLTGMVGRDAAGYAMPQGLRNVLMISATPYQWKHMISQRTCRRNTLETQYVMLRCWEDLCKLGVMFDNAGPGCMTLGCEEGKMACGHGMVDKEVAAYWQAHKCSVPTALLDINFSAIRLQQAYNSGCC